MFYVYLLVATNGNTYVGATMNLEKRLRQHNKEIKGGACATGRLVSKGQTWTRAIHVSGFPSWSAALQFEWRWKQLSRKISFQIKPIERRLEALKQLLNLERSTSKAIAFCEWIEPPKVHLEIDEVTEYYNKINLNPPE
jgi:structure-specific endonuclease subunit SLX1